MVRSVLFITAKPGLRQRLVDTFNRIDVPGHAMQQDGCLSVELQVPPDAEGPILVTALWRDRAAYQGWLDNPWRAYSTAEIEPFVGAEPAIGVVYDIVAVAGNPFAIGPD